LWINDKQIINEGGNITANNLTITGSLIGASVDGWSNVELPDEDNANWVPANNTRYFIRQFTTNRTLTMNQQSLNTAYPNAPDKTIIRFDFPPCLAINEPDPNDPNTILPYRKKYFDFVFDDVFVIEDETSSSSSSSYSYVEYTNGAYLMKTNSTWIVVIPVFSYD